MRGADLSGANLYYANLRGADLSGANLRDADLRVADLYDANLYYAKNIPNLPLACPEEGSFIGWKKVNDAQNSYLVKLEIPADAKRSSATSDKCRCDKAKVLSITNLKNSTEIDEITNYNYEPNIVYKVGEMVYPDSFDEDRWNECSHGIHFFIDKQKAIDY